MYIHKNLLYLLFSEKWCLKIQLVINFFTAGFWTSAPNHGGILQSECWALSEGEPLKQTMDGI